MGANAAQRHMSAFSLRFRAVVVGMTKRQQMDWCCEHNNEAGGRVGRRITDRWPVLRGSRRKLAIGRSAKFSHSADAAPSINGHGYTSSADAGYGAVGPASSPLDAAPSINGRGYTSSADAGYGAVGPASGPLAAVPSINGRGHTSSADAGCGAIGPASGPLAAVPSINGRGHTSAAELADRGGYVGSKSTADPRNVASLGLL
jgi:hypothetical protein